MNSLFQLSLLAAFIAGMVALFAPCCITFLLPAYFANIFREKKRAIVMTFIYSLGIFTIMLPVVLGARVLSQLFFKMHDQTYLIGGGFLLLVGLMALLGLKLPMPRINTNLQAKDPMSTYILGIFSGITSACCAPVLIGVMALSSLSPTTIQSLLVGFFYVLGMVTPLYLASLLIDKGNILNKPWLRKPLGEIKIGKKTYLILLTNLVSFVMFTLVGLATIFLTLSGKLAMKAGEDSVARAIQQVALQATYWVQKVPLLDFGFVILAGLALYRLGRLIWKKD